MIQKKDSVTKEEIEVNTAEQTIQKESKTSEVVKLENEEKNQ